MQLHLKQLGHGEPVVLLHGLFGQADNWFGVAPKLAEKFHLLIPDLRNHGHSPHHPEMDYPLMAADVDKFFAAQQIESAHVIGHSMGGKVAMQLALDFPARVKKLVVMDIAPRAYQRTHDHIFDALLALDLQQFRMRQEIEDVLEPDIPSLGLRRFLLKNLGRDNHGNFVWKMNLRGVAENYLNLGKVVERRSPDRRVVVGEENTLHRNPAIPNDIGFAGSTLFIRGGKADYITAADEPEIRQLFPSAKIQTIPEAGHWIHADAPEEFVSMVLDFL
jgi:pimeloyl-ACP methyl ester carboxylesterase